MRPPLLIVDGNYTPVHRIESGAYAQLRCEKLLVIVLGATHLFEEPGTLDAVAQLARDWFERFLRRTA
jgi:putative phosphoribosyl transferase